MTKPVDQQTEKELQRLLQNVSVARDARDLAKRETSFWRHQGNIQNAEDNLAGAIAKLNDHVKLRVSAK